MSNISTAYDAFAARVAAVLPNHSVLTNPYAPDQNLEPTLRKAWGIRIRNGSNTNRGVNCIFSIGRQLELVLTRKFYGAELNRDAKEDTQKQLLEDHFLVVKDIEQDPTLAASSAVAKFGYVGDSGIEFVYAEDKPFFQIIITFELEYFENFS